MGCGRLWSRLGFENTLEFNVFTDYMHTRASKFLILGKLFRFLALLRFRW